MLNVKTLDLRLMLNVNNFDGFGSEVREILAGCGWQAKSVPDQSIFTWINAFLATLCNFVGKLC